jgi:hypothetical protein
MLPNHHDFRDEVTDCVLVITPKDAIDTLIVEICHIPTYIAMELGIFLDIFL